MGALAVVGVVAAVGGIASLVIVRAMNKPQTYLVKGTAGRVATTRPPVPSLELDLRASGAPLVASVDTDHADDFIVYDTHDKTQRGGSYVAVNTRREEILWRTPPIDPPSSATSSRFAWVAGRAFLVARDQTLYVHSLDTGRRTNTIALSAPIVRPCVSLPPTLARLSLPGEDIEITASGAVEHATGECFPTDTDGFVADHGRTNGNAVLCDQGHAPCQNRLALVLPEGFSPLESKRFEKRDLPPGTKGPYEFVLGLHQGQAVLARLDDKRLAWTTTLTPPRIEPTFVPEPVAAAPSRNDPALGVWDASAQVILLLRRYKDSAWMTRTDDTVVRSTSIEGLDGTTGKRIFTTLVPGRVGGVREKDGYWILATRDSIWELHGADGALRKLAGPTDPTGTLD